jgi:hypothetical protein
LLRRVGHAATAATDIVYLKRRMPNDAIIHIIGRYSLIKTNFWRHLGAAHTL